uniref:Glucose-methanol-choline oxidoreductase N-terminal domain-containing protein n=1 Tax=Clastoptera arizonana TaxID=38151 RepID=A0A1B6C574_9HEMI
MLDNLTIDTVFPSPSWIHQPCVAQTSGYPAFLFSQLVNSLLASQCALMLPPYPDNCAPYITSSDKDITFDFVIVGGGVAGSILANRLSETDSWRVLLIEAGHDPPMTARVPKYHKEILGSSIDWQYVSEAEDGMYRGMKNGRNNWPRGKALGGSSVLGRMLYSRGTKYDYDRWGKSVEKGWDYDDVLGSFKISENMQDLSIMGNEHLAEYHATNGFLNLNLFKSSSEVIPILKEAVLDLQMNGIADEEEDPEQFGFVHMHATIDHGERLDVARAFLTAVKDRPNLFVMKDCFVTKILFDSNKRAYGIEYIYKSDKKTRKILAKKEVVLTAGTINSAQLLMLSGVGPENQLKPLGIPVVQNLQVGCNLQDHPIFYGAVITINLTNPDNCGDPDLDEAFEYFNYREGPLSNIGLSELVGYIGVRKNSTIPDIEIYSMFFRHNNTQDFEVFSKTISLSEDAVNAYLNFIREHNVLIMMPILLRPKSRGSVKLRSKDPYDKPLISPKYMSHPEDRSTLVSGIRYISDLVNSHTFKTLNAELKQFPFDDCEEIEFETDEHWLCMMSYLLGTFHDPVGTVKMGMTKDRTSVVDDRLKVKGVKGLRVADASIMPFITSGGTMAPTMMIAEKAASIMKADYLAHNNVPECSKMSENSEC